MTTSDLDIMPADAPMPVRARAAKAAPKSEPEQAPVVPVKQGHALHVFVGTDTPVVLTFPTKEAREKACTALSQRVNRMATVLASEGKVYTFIYVTHFICEE